MTERISESLQQKLSDRLRYYEDIGLDRFYRSRGLALHEETPVAATTPSIEEETLPKKKEQKTSPAMASAPIAPTRKPEPLPVTAGPPLFQTFNKIEGDTLLKIREDLGECTRCKLHKTRNKIVFGDGSPKAQLVFVGEGPGADEDAQGLPFVGRAGKLLTQMIEAMGLQRKDVYICNVVKSARRKIASRNEMKSQLVLHFLCGRLMRLRRK